ncbi:hypothetical protein [Paenibacillus bouchesdurhonensis]|uniref:hypothetical protein n=1 Tax=Paenibacillus bouchesdurhonensis TaxID=1870990 RepID=UPI000DA62EA8|nr:hypothetical protein [Paenibacillus bouchesdurhonensis]
MRLKVKENQKVLTGGRTYKSGEIIPKLDEVEERRLLSLGVCEAAPDIQPVDNDEEKGSPGTVPEPDSNLDNGQLPLFGLPLSVEQFAKLKADEQKARLKELEIDPSGKEEERVARYEEWYHNQLTNGDLNVQL